ncbi:MAG: tRNA uridine-5-carboxymethylaminomethyl(34) synthesis GTPase MnmE [candidate division KSB1 bacterium]|nr:tRNA uridine-5-carboxymethylaminomethyl(34) synthesis GTPase MnmE [candidate division KSB1 bacterium]MDZ7399812.1 tRNA uridine-5-carboxymethylaminomethyl(34) synthesis GTPase MnmE [candidate division KSB1 bacterium]
MQKEDTIVAIGTPPGYGAIAVIRLSGPEAIRIADKIIKARKPIASLAPWTAILGKVVDEGLVVDEVIAIVYKAPRSYTKEDMVELMCHGGRLVARRIMEIALKHGARLAQAGEFTLRAYLNGRIDLSQAEAVADLIQAKTEAGLRAAIVQLEGTLSKEINTIISKIVDVCSLLELELDFSEEDVQFVDRERLIYLIGEAEQFLETLCLSYRYGKFAREGAKVVIVGKPNVGKSSLFNLLAKEERAIVTDIPGTTRDPLEVQLDINGILFHIFDTAGIKRASDPIEAEGIRLSKRHLEQADIVIHLFDGSRPLDNEDYEIMNMIQQMKQIVLMRVINKIDLKLEIDGDEIAEQGIPLIRISAIQGQGVDAIERRLFEIVDKERHSYSQGQAFITNIRHRELLSNALVTIKQAKMEAEKGVSSEFLSVYLREALNHLGQITGKVTSEDILNNIFAKFCIGK